MSAKASRDFARRMRVNFFGPIVALQEQVAKSTEVYRAIEQRLRTSFHPPILLDHCIEPGSLRVESSVLGGIWFKTKNFQSMLQSFREATNDTGETAFDYHPLTADKVKHFIKNLVSLDF